MAALVASAHRLRAPGVYQGAANVIAAVMLLLEFGMLRQALIRDQIRLYAAQSVLISVLAIVIAADRGLPDLYALPIRLRIGLTPLEFSRWRPRSSPEPPRPANPAGAAGASALARGPAPGCYRCSGIAGHRHGAAGSSTEAWL